MMDFIRTPREVANWAPTLVNLVPDPAPACAWTTTLMSVFKKGKSVFCSRASCSGMMKSYR